MNLYHSELFMQDIREAAQTDLPWEKLKDKTVVVSGASGLIGSAFVDVLLEKNRTDSLNCRVVALCRNGKRARERFSERTEADCLYITEADVNQPLDMIEKADFVLHLASNTHPVAYATDPIGTITTNIIGTTNMLDMACRAGSERFLFASSNEIYGENRGDQELFDESYCGYIDCNTLRAGYPESKRCGEALCQAYIRQKGMDCVIARLTRSYGPTILDSDTKAISQFFKKALNGEDIVLKSAGNQYYSYTYVTDAVTGLLTVLLKGECGEAYNIADQASDITLKDLSGLIASAAGRKVVFELPDAVESAGYSKATKARLSGRKLKELGWQPGKDISMGVERTLIVLKQINS